MPKIPTVTHEARPHPLTGHIDPGLLHFQAAEGGRPLPQACSSLRPLRRAPSGHPQIAQAKQRDPVRGVLGQPFVAQRVASEPMRDDPTRVFNLGAHAGLHLPPASCTKRSPYPAPLACMQAWPRASFNKQKGHHGGELGARHTFIATQCAKTLTRTLQNWSDSKAHISYVRTRLMRWT